MSVFRDIPVEWEGRTYTLTPSNKLLRKIEMGGNISLPQLAQGIVQGRPQLGVLSYVIAELLVAAGVQGVDEDRILHKMVNTTSDEVSRLSLLVVQFLNPPEQDEKKPEAPAASKAVKK